MAGEHRIGAVLGDMLELGDEEQNAHQAIADQAGAMDLDPLLFIGPRFGRVRLPQQARHFADAAAASAWLAGQSIQDRLLLLKGSRSIGVEAVLEGLG
jgi:UDP-N-acetylmuramoyl-tripeptide--D-alanyl-D-alanine ligase